MIVGCLFNRHRENPAEIQIFAQPLNHDIERYLKQQLNSRQLFFAATPKPEGKPIRSTVPNGENLAEIQTFVQRLNPQMEHYLEQQLQRR